MPKWKCWPLINLGLGFSLAFVIPCIQRQVPSISAQIRPLNDESIAVLDNRVNSIMEKQQIPGIAVAIIRDGVVEVKGYGVEDMTTEKPVNPNTAFAIGSISKPFTAMAIMMLVEEGQLDLDKPINQYLRDLPEQWKSLTLRQLLSHTAGISEAHSWRGVEQPQDFIKVAGKKELDFLPGESWSYSNSGFYLAGLVIEQVSVQSYRDFMQERIFSPLGMEQTQAQLAPVPNLATGYEGKGKNLQKMDLDQEQSVYAAGNIISTASDMVKWLQALNQGQLLSQSSYEQLWTSSILNNGRTTGYGLGWFVDSFNGHPYTEHSGNVRGYSSGLYRYPNERLDVVILTNNSNINVSGALIANFIAGVYQPSVSLVGLNSQPDPHPLFTQSFLSFLQGDKQNIALAPEFQLQLQTKRGKFLKKYMKAFRHIDKLEFLHEEINNGDRSYYYQTTLEGNLIYVFVKVTEKQQIASYAAVNSPQF